MTTKCTGAEFMRFYTDEAHWPGEMWHEDETVLVNGGEVPDYSEKHIALDAKVEIEGGAVFSDGLGRCEVGSFEGHFKKWRKAQSTVSFVVECQKDRIDAIKDAIKSAGGRVLK